MIDPKELRIGNYVFIDGKIPAKVHAIESGRVSIGQIGPHDWVDKDSIETIPLTREILEKCGFEITNDKHLSYQVAYVKDTIVLDKHFQLYVDGDEAKKYGLHLKYLHQLQNLYFALTGQELYVEM